MTSTTPEHRIELPEDPVTSLNLVAMAADAWGGMWQAEGRGQGRLGLPVTAGLRRGWVAGQLTAEPDGDGSRLTFRIDKSEYRVWKVEHYDRKSSLLKTLTLASYKQYLGKYWRAHQLAMVNHQSGKSTTLDWSDYQFRVGLSDRDFSKNSLKRAR